MSIPSHFGSHPDERATTEQPRAVRTTPAHSRRQRGAAHVRLFVGIQQ